MIHRRALCTYTCEKCKEKFVHDVGRDLTCPYCGNKQKGILIFDTDNSYEEFKKRFITNPNPKTK